MLVCIANQTGVNLEEAFQKNLDKKTNRDAHRHVESRNYNRLHLRFNGYLNMSKDQKETKETPKTENNKSLKIIVLVLLVTVTALAAAYFLMNDEKVVKQEPILVVQEEAR